jgi:hypothetical protein
MAIMDATSARRAIKIIPLFILLPSLLSVTISITAKNFYRDIIFPSIVDITMKTDIIGIIKHGGLS